MANRSLDPGESSPDTNRPRQFRLRTHLIALLMILLVPCFMLGAAVTWEALDAYRDAYVERLRDTAHTLALAVDREIGAYRAAMEILAGSTALDGPEPNLAAFEVAAHRASLALDATIILLDPVSRRQIVNTNLSPGESAGRISAADVRAAVETRRPMVSDVFRSAVTKQPVVGVAVPVVRDGDVRFVLTAQMNAAELSHLVRKAGELDAAGFAVVVDWTGKVAARSREHEKFVMDMAPTWYLSGIAGRDAGFLQGHNLEGKEVALGFARLTSAPGWTVAVTEPWAAYLESWRRPLAELAVGAAVIFVLGAALAFGLARRLIRPVTALAHNARAFAAAAPAETIPFPESLPSSVREFEDMRLGLAAAGAAATMRAAAKREAEERQTLLMREVDHRAKNALAIALSLIRLAPRDVPPEQFANTIEGRIAAMARAHSLLAHERWSGADLRTAAKAELSPYAERIHLAGPKATLSAEAVQPLTMILHELATNAAKYGALSLPNGRISFTWESDGDGGLRLRWVETGGPPVQSPSEGPGFGVRLTTTLAERQLGGRIEFDWRVTGLQVGFALPERQMIQVAGLAESTDGKTGRTKPGKLTRGAPGIAAALSGARPRVLVVEDETLLALELKVLLERIGCEVVGPAHTLHEALQLVADEDGVPDVALLDVNLGAGDRSFPVADLLVSRNIPFIFITGYGSETALAGHDSNAVAILRKPLDQAILVEAIRQAIARSAESSPPKGRHDRS